MTTEKKANQNEAFVKFVIDLIHKDNGVAAVFKRADNPATEYQCWEYLARFIDIDKDYERLPFATIASAIAKAKTVQNGTTLIGAALALAYDEGSNSDQAKAKLRRLLACDDVEEACRVLRPLFSLIDARANVQLDYAALLKDLRGFYSDEQRQRVKSRWAQNFYRSYPSNEAVK